MRGRVWERDVPPPMRSAEAKCTEVYWKATVSTKLDILLFINVGSGGGEGGGGGEGEGGRGGGCSSPSPLNTALVFVHELYAWVCSCF